MITVYVIQPHEQLPQSGNLIEMLQAQVAKSSSWRVWLGSWRSGGSTGRTGKSGSGGMDAAVAAAAAAAHPRSPAAQQVSHLSDSAVQPAYRLGVLSSSQHCLPPCVQQVVHLHASVLHTLRWTRLSICSTRLSICSTQNSTVLEGKTFFILFACFDRVGLRW